MRAEIEPSRASARNTLFFRVCRRNGGDARTAHKGHIGARKAISYKAGGTRLTAFLGQFGFSAAAQSPTMHSSQNDFTK
jgi:hypothetical protein